MSKSSRRKSLWLAGVLVLVALMLTGCVEVQVVDSTPSAEASDAFASPLAVEDASRNLAVLAVEFDPPLNYQQLILRRQAVELLVAVENNGRVTERDVRVGARLSSPEDPDFVVTQDSSLLSIAPGEIQLVRFARLDEIPFHQVYRLEVWVDAVAGERDLADNQKAFDIQIHKE